MGLIHGVSVLPANIQDRDGAKRLLEPLVSKLPRLERLWADGGYAGKLETWVREQTTWQLEIVRRPEGSKGFVLLPKRWVVERTFAWLNKCRRLRSDYEVSCTSSEAMIRLAMIGVMLRRLRRT